MKEIKKAILGAIKKNEKREDKFENLVLHLALKKLKGARHDDDGVVYSKSGRRVIMAAKTIEGNYTVAEGTERIEDDAFWGCAFLTGIELPQTLKSIGNEAFARCISLKSVTIPESVETLGHNPFVGLSSEAVKCLSPHYTIENKVLYTADRHEVVAVLTDAALIILPKTVETIGSHAFARRRALKKVVIPEGVTVIGDDAFADCDSLEEITIPASVMEIGDYAFAECDNLKKVTFVGEVKKLSRHIFSDCDSLTSIIVPAGTADTYRKQLHIPADGDLLISEYGQVEEPAEDTASDEKKADEKKADEKKADKKKDSDGKKSDKKKKKKDNAAEPATDAAELATEKVEDNDTDAEA